MRIFISFALAIRTIQFVFLLCAAESLSITVMLVLWFVSRLLFYLILYLEKFDLLSLFHWIALNVVIREFGSVLDIVGNGLTFPLIVSDFLEFSANYITSITIEYFFLELVFNIIFIAVYYVLKPKSYKIYDLSTDVDKKRAVTFVGSIALAGIYYLFQNGGIGQVFMSFGEVGRLESTKNIGPLARLFKMSWVPIVFLIIREKGKVANLKLSILLFLSIIFLQFVITGSRSGIVWLILPVILTLYKFKAISLRLIYISAISGGVILKVLGVIRNFLMFGQGDLSFLDYWNQSTIGATKRFGDFLMIRNYVDTEGEFLYGMPFTTPVMSIIPRYILNNKPHSSGYYFGRDILGVDYGVPINEIAELYWNFGYFGVLLFPVFKAVFVIVSLRLIKSSSNIILYSMGIIMLISMGAMTSLNFNFIMQSVMLLFLIKLIVVRNEKIYL